MENESQQIIQEEAPAESLDFDHPWFSQENKCVQFVKDMLANDESKDAKEFAEKVDGFARKEGGAKELFGKPLEDLAQELTELGITFPSPCGKSIENNQYFYRCLDCDKFSQIDSSFITVICHECFSRSNHAGHRVFMTLKNNESTGICDCGDTECLKEEGFCDQHRYVKINPEEILEKLPLNIKEPFLTKYQEEFYTRVCLIEEVLRNPTRKDVPKLQILSFSLMNRTYIAKELIEANLAFIILVSYLFRTPLPKGKNMVYHNCDNFEELTLTNELHECKCTLLELYCRTLKFFILPIEKTYTDLFTELLRDDLFKLHINETFCKYLNFLVPKLNGTENPKVVPPVKDLFRMGAQIFGTESLCLLPIQNSTINNFWSCLLRIIKHSFYPGDAIAQQIDEIGCLIGYSFQATSRAAGYELIHKNNYFKNVFELLMSYNIKFCYPKKIGIGTLPPDIDYKLMNNIFVTSRSIEYLIEKGYKAIEFEPIEEKKNFMFLILEDWYNSFKNTQCIIDIELSTHPDQLFYPTFERMLTLMLTSYIKPLSQQSLKNFFNEGLKLKTSEELIDFGQNFGKNVLNNFGAFRYLQLIHNYQAGPLHYVYLFINNLMHEHDIIALQMTTLVLDKIDIFEYFSKNFFTYSSEISDFLLKEEKLVEDDRIKHKFIVIEDFLALINFIMSDELCYLSSQVGKKNQKLVDTPEFDERYYKVIKKLLINLMGSFYWTTLKRVKESLKNLIKEYEFTEKIIHEISDINSENFQIRLKDQYLKEFDPYFFYKTRAMQKNVVLAFLNRSSGAKLDSVSGQFYTDLPQYLYDIQIKFFTSSLLPALKNIIVNWIDQFPNLLTITLRLIFLNLQLIDFLKDENKQILIEKFTSVFADPAFIEKLHSLLTSENFQEYIPCIKKIFKGLKEIGAQFQVLIPGDLFEAEGVGSPQLNKKELAQERMKKLQEQFSLKQKAFADKNLTEIQNVEEKKENEEVKQDIDDEKCQYCLEPLANGKAYGIPIYLVVANNFGYEGTDPFKINQNGLQGSFEEQYPVMTTCNHHFHEECYTIIHEKTWAPQNHARNQTMYFNLFESNCPVCKTLANNFLPLSEATKEDIKPQIQETPVNDQIKENNEREAQENEPLSTIAQEDGEIKDISFEKKPKHDFIEKCVKLLHYAKKRNPFDVANVATPQEFEILNKSIEMAIVYFLESAYLHPTQKEVKQRFSLLFHFLKSYYRGPQEGTTDQKDQPYSLPIELEVQDLPSYNFFICKNSTEFEEKTIQINDLIKTVCSKLLIHNVSNKNYAREYLKKLIVRFVRGTALTLIRLANNKDSQHISDILSSTNLFKQKFFETIHYPVVSLFYIYLLLSAQNLERNDWKEAEFKLNLLFNNQIEEEDYFNEILKVFNEENFSLNQILKEANKFEGLNDYSELCTLSQKLDESVPLEIELVNNLNIKRKTPFFVSLPPTYFEFNEKYLSSQCILCKQHKSTSNICLCLICGNVICKRSCSANVAPQVGNLSIHAFRCHNASAVFLDIKELVVYMISFPEIVLYNSNLYVNAFGTSLKEIMEEARLNKLDFKTMHLNKKLIQEIKAISDSTFRIPQTINKVIRETQYKIRPNYY